MTEMRKIADKLTYASLTVGILVLISMIINPDENYNLALCLQSVLLGVNCYVLRLCLRGPEMIDMKLEARASEC